MTQQHNPASPETAAAALHAIPEVRYRELFDQAPISIQILRPDGFTVRVNKAWQALWHIHEGGALYGFVLSSAYNVLTDPQLVDHGIVDYLRRATSGESVQIPAIHYDTTAIGGTSRTRWVTARAHPIKDAEGRIVEVMLMHEDITERVEAEAALRAREERFRSLVMATTQVVWTSGPDGRVVEPSPSWQAFTGQADAAFSDDGWLDAVHPDDRERARAVYRRAIAERAVYETEYRLRRHDGEYRWTAVKGVPILDAAGAVREWIGANRDIHDIVMAQAELAERLDREQRQSALLAKVASAARALHMLLTKAEITEVLLREVRAIVGVEGVRVTLGEEAPRAPGPAPGAEWLSIPLVSRKGRRLGLLEAWDKHGGFTEEDEAILVQLGAIATNGFENALLYDSLRQQDRRKDEFLAMLAHELRNPMAPIAAAAEVLRISASPEHVRRSSEVIGRQVKHMTSLVDDLLDVSRVTRGLVKLDRRKVTVAELVASAVEQSRPLMETHGHAFATEVEAGPIQVDGDPARLVQVLVNLLNNAAKYTPRGGRIALRVAREGERVQFCIADNGIGIDRALLPHVFDLFTQAERTPDRSQGGLGIGLALVRTLVALHGGEVQAHSEGSGTGCTFTVWLPLVP
ncbi:MAG: PAS domain-containing sensor histidine kinase [Janthinobacterium lividum]